MATENGTTPTAGHEALVKLFETCDLLRSALGHSDGPEELAARTLTIAALSRLENAASAFGDLVPRPEDAGAGEAPTAPAAVSVSGETPSNGELADDLQRVREALWQVTTLARLVGRADLEELAADGAADCDLENIADVIVGKLTPCSEILDLAERRLRVEGGAA